MNLATLAPVDRQTLCVKVEEACLNRVREILRRADPADAALRRLLEDVERQHQVRSDSVRVVSGFDDGDPRTHLPSLRSHLGEAALNRDCALFHLECLMEEARRFFETMARRADNEESRKICARIALNEIGRVAHLRTVIL